MWLVPQRGHSEGEVMAQTRTDPESQASSLRVAVVGAGPAGVYAADLLLKHAPEDIAVSIDLFERLPAPYGLVRYGVAPDHPRIRGIIDALRDVLDRGVIRIFGNVNYGTDITMDDLKRHYHAVIFATGAILDADLAIPGIHLPGSLGAADFVNWYDGHPDVPRTWPLTSSSVAVIGNGNVALDVARVLAKFADDMLPTDIPDNVYEGLKASAVTDVHVIGRRGPAQSKFTPLELRELGEVPGVDMVLDPRDFVYDEQSQQEIESNNQKRVLARIYQSWLDREPGTASHRIHLHFYAKPVEVLGDEVAGVTGVRIERTEPTGDGGVRGTGEFSDIAVGQVYRAIGYSGSPVAEVPFDAARGVFPNVGGRVVDESGAVVPGVYATGWIKRGPVGLIGSTKSDALETVQNLLADRSSLWQPAEPSEESIPELLASRNVAYTDLDGWHRLDAHEREQGAARGRERIKTVDRDLMVRVSRNGAEG